MIRTSDGGANWAQQSVETQTLIHSIVAVDTNTAWVVAQDAYTITGYYRYKIIKTTDGGKTWTSVWVHTANSSNISLAAADAKTAWFTLTSSGQRSSLYHTMDGGLTWNIQDAPQQLASSSTGFTTIAAIDANTAWVGGSYGVILHTITGGK